MSTCTVCSHPDRESIDLDLVAGKAVRSVANRCGLTRWALLRHKRNHISADLARVAAARDLARVTTLAVEVGTQEAQAQSRALNVLAELERTFLQVRKIFDACDAWLSDPDHPDRYDLGPRAEEIVVHYTRPGATAGSGPVRAKATLSALLAGLAEDAGSAFHVDGVELRTADPRELVLKAARRLEAELQLIARLLGELAEPQQNTVNVLVASPEWIATRAAILQALEPYPDARAAVVEALKHVAVAN